MAHAKQAVKGWISMEEMKTCITTAPKILYEELIIIASDDGIYSYHLSKNKYHEIWKYPLGFEPLRHSILADHKSQKIYLYNNIPSATDVFYEIDIVSKSSITYKGSFHGYLCVYTYIIYICT